MSTEDPTRPLSPAHPGLPIQRAVLRVRVLPRPTCPCVHLGLHSHGCISVCRTPVTLLPAPPRLSPPASGGHVHHVERRPRVSGAITAAAAFTPVLQAHLQQVFSPLIRPRESHAGGHGMIWIPGPWCQLHQPGLWGLHTAPSTAPRPLCTTVRVTAGVAADVSLSTPGSLPVSEAVDLKPHQGKSDLVRARPSGSGLRSLPTICLSSSKSPPTKRRGGGGRGGNLRA